MVKFYQNLNLGVKIGGGFTLLLLISIILTFVGYNGLKNIKLDLAITNDAVYYESTALKIKENEKNLMLKNDKEYLKEINKMISSMLKQSESTKNKMQQQKDKNDINEMEKIASQYEKAVNTYAESLFKQNELRNNFLKSEENLLSSVSRIVEVQNEELDNIMASLNNNSNNSSNFEAENLEKKINTIKYANQLKENINQIGLQERNYIINLANFEQQKLYAEKIINNFSESETIVNNLIQGFDKTNDIEIGKEILAEIKATENTFREVNGLEQIKDENKVLMENKAEAFIESADNLQEDQLLEIEMEEVSAIRKLIITVIISLIAGVLLAVIITKGITKAINKASDIAQEIALGNLNIKVPGAYLNRKDEVGLLAKSLDKMIGNLKGLIGKVADISSNLSASSEELSASGEEVATAATQVGESIQQVASGAEEQSAQVEETNTKINGLIKQIKSVKRNSEEMDTQAENVMQNINEGNESVDNSVNQIKKVKTNSKEVFKTINNLGDLSDKIGEIVGLINNIAAQTNLLALNAAIEAARAGEAGRGFSVVADEIRQLAEESEGATNQIGDLVKEIQNGVGDAVEKMDTTEEVVNGSVSAIQNTGESFGKINKAAIKLRKLIGQINNKSNKVDQNAGEVETIVKEIAKVSEEAASNSQEVAAASEEQSASTEEIVSAADELAAMANDLTNAVSQFEL